MIKIKPIYYQKNASYLGWGNDTAKLDQERVSLLKKYLIGKKILDIGCGMGLYVDLITSWGYEGWGMDHVTDFINKAKKTKKGNFKQGKAEKLPFKDNEFDTVLLFDILEHLDDEIVLKEAKRVCSKRILIIVPKEVDRKIEQSGVIFRHYLDKSHLREYQDKDIENLSKKTNLKLIHLETVHPLNIKTIFLSLFEGSLFIKKGIHKVASLLLTPKTYFTEYFVVFEK